MHDQNMTPHLWSPLAIAPMIDWTYTHFRVFMRLLAPRALLYTDMQTIGAITHHPQRALQFDPREHPLALQIGGNDAEGLASCALLAQKQGFVEVNVNLGCPSDRVQSGQFGACLMAHKEQVAHLIKTMKNRVQIAVTAKTRIGIDEQDSFEFFREFVDTLLEAGCDKLVVHARKAWLNGLSPKQNRSIPPLHYDYVYHIKQLYPHMTVVINGNIQSTHEISEHLQQVDGVMLGRLAYQNPYAIAHIHHHLYPNCPLSSRSSVLQTYLEYVSCQQQKGIPLSILLKPIFNLSHGLNNAKAWREAVMQTLREPQKNDLFSLVTGLKTLEELSCFA